MTNEHGQLRELRAELKVHGMTAHPTKGGHISVLRDGKRVGTLCFTRRSPNIKTIVKRLLRDIEKDDMRKVS